MRVRFRSVRQQEAAGYQLGHSPVVGRERRGIAYTSRLDHSRLVLNVRRVLGVLPDVTDGPLVLRRILQVADDPGVAFVNADLLTPERDAWIVRYLQDAPED